MPASTLLSSFLSPSCGSTVINWSKFIKNWCWSVLSSLLLSSLPPSIPEHLQRTPAQVSSLVQISLNFKRVNHISPQSEKDCHRTMGLYFRWCSENTSLNYQMIFLSFCMKIAGLLWHFSGSIYWGWSCLSLWCWWIFWCLRILWKQWQLAKSEGKCWRPSSWCCYWSSLWFRWWCLQTLFGWPQR